jgi:hypothetical protein
MNDKFENLQQLLEKQITFAQAGKIDEVDDLARQAEALINSCAGAGEVPENIKKLHDRLCLIIETNMTDTAMVLKATKKNRLAARAYLKNI